MVKNDLFETSSDLGISFPGCIKGRYSEDKFFTPMLANPDEFTNFMIKDDLVFFTSEEAERVAVPDILVNDQRVREVLIGQAHSILAHLSDEKMITYMRDQVWWKSMVNDVSVYCKSCQTCAVSKPQQGKVHGKLKTMLVLTYPWQYIGIDFVGPLPESTNCTGDYDMICVIIDLLTSMVHLVPTRQTYRAIDIAELMFEHVYKLHGIPERIISDRDSLFTSKFWKRLHHLVGTQLRMSSVFHLQTDGATERANRTVTQMIRQCVRPDQKDWTIKLPAVEFAINSARSSTTGFSPFQLNYERNPSPMVWNVQDEFPGLWKFAKRMKKAIMSAHDSIIAAWVVNTVETNRKCVAVSYKVGDLMYLSTKNISLPKGRARKLAPKYLGPFLITKVLRDGATYQLNLSDELMKRGINHSFHALLLKLHVPSDDRRFPGRLPVQIPGFGGKSEEWIVDSIVSHHGRGVSSEFEIQWKAGDRTWVLYREVAHLIALDQYCELMGVEGPQNLPASYPKKGGTSDALVGVIRVVPGGYKTERSGEGGTHLPSMTRTISTEEWSNCVLYERQINLYRHGTGRHPGSPPPRYTDYCLSTGSQRDSSRHSAHRHTLDLHSPSPQGIISMPQGALSSFFDTQYRMVELMVGAGGHRMGVAPTHFAPAPMPGPRPAKRPRRNHRNRSDRGRGRGRVRGGFRGYQLS